MVSYGVVVHGGAGSSIRLTGACKRACEAAFVLLEKGHHALEAAVEAIRLLEDDGRFNAGTGSTLRLDGTTVEMDASVMVLDRKAGDGLRERARSCSPEDSIWRCAHPPHGVPSRDTRKRGSA